MKPKEDWRSHTPPDYGFDWGDNLQVRRVCSLPEGHKVLFLHTPSGTIELYVSPQGRRVTMRRVRKGWSKDKVVSV